MTPKELDKLRKRHKGYNQPDKWDRIKRNLMQGDPLPEEDEVFVQRAVLIWAKMIKGETEREIVSWVVSQEWSKERQAYNLLRDTKRLYGIDPVGANLAAEKRLLLEQARELHMLCKAADKHREALGALKLIKDLLSSFSDDHNLRDLYETLEIPEIHYTDDPSVLELPPVQDVEHEEI